VISKLKGNFSGLPSLLKIAFYRMGFMNPIQKMVPFLPKGVKINTAPARVLVFVPVGGVKFIAYLIGKPGYYAFNFSTSALLDKIKVLISQPMPAHIKPDHDFSEQPSGY
jgi:hypothetical protein